MFFDSKLLMSPIVNQVSSSTDWLETKSTPQSQVLCEKRINLLMIGLKLRDDHAKKLAKIRSLVIRNLIYFVRRKVI